MTETEIDAYLDTWWKNGAGIEGLQRMKAHWLKHRASDPQQPSCNCLVEYDEHCTCACHSRLEAIDMSDPQQPVTGGGGVRDE